VDMAYRLFRKSPERNHKAHTSLLYHFDASNTHFYYTGMDSVDMEIRAAATVKFRYYFQEPSSEVAFRVLDFDGEYTWQL